MNETLKEIESKVKAKNQSRIKKASAIDEEDEALMNQCFTYEHYRVGLDYFFLYYCPATVDCHETKVINAGNQVLFGNQLLLLGNQVYTQENSDFSRVHYLKILIN